MQQKSNGALISSIIIIILLIIGGIFLWKTSVKNEVINQPSTQENGSISDSASSDAEISSIDADVNSMDYNGLDEGI